MGYKDSNNRPLSPQQNPYAAFGSASAVAGQDIRHPIAEIDSIANLIERVKYILDYQTEPIRFFLQETTEQVNRLVLTLLGKRLLRDTIIVFAFLLNFKKLLIK